MTIFQRSMAPPSHTTPRLIRCQRAELARIGAILRRRAAARGLAGFSLAIALCLLISAAAFLESRQLAHPALTRCCAERDGFPLGIWLSRLPGSLIAPPPGLPVWGSLLQVLVVLGVAEAAVGRTLTASVGFAGHFISGVVARVLVGLGPHGFLGLSAADRFVLDTGPSAATVALTAYIVVRLRCPMLGSLAAAGLSLAMLAHSDLAACEHIVAWLVGMLCGSVHLLVLRRREVRSDS